MLACTWIRQGSIFRIHSLKTFSVMLNVLRSSHRFYHSCLAFIGRRDCVPVSCGVSQSPRSHQDSSVSLHRDVSLVRSLTLLLVPTLLQRESPSLHGFLFHSSFTSSAASANS